LNTSAESAAASITRAARFGAGNAEAVLGVAVKGADALDRRPQLAAALAAARSAKCAVLVSKLDRLSRDVAFVSGLMATACRSSSPSGVGTPWQALDVAI